VAILKILIRSCHRNKKGEIQKFLGFLSSNFMKLCKNIHRSVWQLLGGLKKFKMATGQLRQSLSNRFRFFLAYIVPLDVDVVPNKFDQFLLGK
jgi:hypothetical protein